MVSEPGIRFVMEGPHAARVRQKKRARLVTACDACRVKKVKCHQLNPKTKCDACKASRTACHFGDRDKYHAERGMSTVNSGSKSTSPPPTPLHISTSVSPDTSGRTSPNGLWSATSEQQDLTTPFLRHLGPTAHVPGYQRVELSRTRRDSISTSSSVSSSAASSPPDSPLDLPYHSLGDFSYTSTHMRSFEDGVGGVNTAQLFDPKSPRYPHPELMEHLAELFFDHLACHVPFLNRDSIMRRIKDGSLPAILANSIAALSSRFSDRDVLTYENCPKYAAGEPFLQMAKLLVVPMMSWPCVEVLHSLILIAWGEYGSARDSGLFMYSRMATAMLLDLGLGNAATIELAKTEEERDMLRFTWWSVARIDLTSSWVTGRPASLRDTQFDITLPSAQHDSNLPSRTLLFAYLTELFTIRDEVTNMMNDESSPDGGLTEARVAGIQARLTSFYATLPESLHFTQDNFRRFSEHKQGSALLLLHLMFHGSNALVHWPSLFKAFDCPVPHGIDVSYASSRSLVDALLIAQSIDPSSILTNPFFDVPVSVAARAFLAGRSAVTKKSEFNKEWNESNLTTCMNVLTDMSRYWGGAAIVRVLLEQRGARSSITMNDHSTQLHNQRHESPDSHNMVPPSLSPPNNNSPPQESNSPQISLTSSYPSTGLPTPIYEHSEFIPQLTPRPLTSQRDQTAAVDDIFGAFFANHLDFGQQPFDNLVLKDGLTPQSHAMTPTQNTTNTGLLTPGLESTLFPPPSWTSML